MEGKWKRELRSAKMIHRPLPLDESEYAEKKLENVRILNTLIISRPESLDGWEVDPLAGMTLEETEGKGLAVKFTAPTRLQTWPHNYARIYHTPYLTKWIDKGEGRDLRKYNRIALWVRPEMPGFKFVSLHLQLVNGGEDPIPDRYEREGCHHMNLKNHQWNHIHVEIPNVSRDCLQAIRFGYDMVGNEREAVDEACFFLSDIRLEQVEKTAKYRGWEPEEGELIYCGSGYRPGGRKIALAHKNAPESFKVLEMESGKVVLEKDSKVLETSEGTFRILDFTEIHEEGEYLIICGEMTSRAIPVAGNIWEPSIWKTINLFFCERCGFEVPGIHKYCHGNVLNHHNGKSVVANGGWHDAADMSQCLANTAEAVYAIFDAAGRQEKGELRERLIEEGKWGLDWMLRTRFGDGYRDMESGGSVWTGNIIGDCDQMDSEAKNYAIENFMAAAAEALAGRILEKEDPCQSRYLKQVSKEDWGFAFEKIDGEEYVEAMDPARVSSPVLLYSAGVLAACEIWRLTGEEFYKEKGIALADRLLQCQQQSDTDWDIPLKGFFYRDEERQEIQHYNHRSYEHYPVMALGALCSLFSGHPDWIRWYHGIVRYTEYYRFTAQFTGPFQMAPASVYHEGEAEKDRELFLAQQAFSHPGMLDEYKNQVHAGVKLGKGYYLRRFPIWFSYRGNSALVLAGGNAAASGALARNSLELWELAEKQLQWITGMNPFGQSLMTGEGYRWAQQYVCLPGPVSGSVCVGIQSFRDTDEPYWPQCSNAVYREMWIHPSIRWLLLASRINQSAGITGIAGQPGEEAEAEETRTGARYSADSDPMDGRFYLKLPAGRYRVRCGEKEQELEVLGGQFYDLGKNFARLTAKAERTGEAVRIAVKNQGWGTVRVSFLADNVAGLAEQELPPGGEAHLEGKLVDGGRPWMVLAVPDGDLKRRTEIYE